MGCPAHKAINFPYFIDPNLYTPTARVAPFVTGAVRFLSAGRLLNSYKGFDVALRALAMARERSGLDNFSYQIAGAGPDEGQLRNLASELGISSKVEFLGWLEPQSLIEHFRTCHALLHPAMEEPYAVAVLEGMAAGMAVFGSDATGAVCDRIRHGQNGFVHPAGDAEALASQIAACLESPHIIERVGKAARTTAREWPIERAADIMDAISRSVLPAR
jgi:glycogen(starch) synthase